MKAIATTLVVRGSTFECGAWLNEVGEGRVVRGFEEVIETCGCFGGLYADFR
jgi:hypothetical protein